MKSIKKLVNENVVGSRLQVSVETGVNWLIDCPFNISKNTILPTPINPESVSWFTTLENGNHVFVYFENKSVYNTEKPVCNVCITETYVKNEMGGINTQYDSLGFLDELLQHVQTETGVVLQYDCFGERV